MTNMGGQALNQLVVLKAVAQSPSGKEKPRAFSGHTWKKANSLRLIPIIRDGTQKLVADLGS